jgi:hypothetical protein
VGGCRSFCGRGGAGDVGGASKGGVRDGEYSARWRCGGCWSCRAKILDDDVIRQCVEVFSSHGSIGVVPGAVGVGAEAGVEVAMVGW